MPFFGIDVLRVNHVGYVVEGIEPIGRLSWSFGCWILLDVQITAVPSAI